MCEVGNASTWKSRRGWREIGKEGLVVLGSVEVKGGRREGDCGEEVWILSDYGFCTLGVGEGEELREYGGGE